MTPTTKADFWKRLYKDPRDIMPSQSNPMFTEWKDRNGRVLGRSTPGWKLVGEESWAWDDSVGK
jgi:hypothetical protein